MKHNIKPCTFDGISPFDIYINYVNIDESPDFEHVSSHFHSQCELYINLSGDVSFMVENNIYHVKKGSIIITKPYEYHHCLYHSKSRHEYFCIWINSHKNEEFLDIFFKRNSGEGNLVILSEENTHKLISLCFELWEDNPTKKRRYYLYFKLLDLLSMGISAENEIVNLSSDIVLALEYIEENYLRKVSISEVARHAHISVNTLERHFKETLKASPTAYINKKRMFHSVILLKNGCSVMEAAEKSGFTDYSGYISKFKKIFGTTPLKYKRISSV